jgi:fatty-acyl-CoA synthase
VKVDSADGRPARGWDGLCIPCGVGEVGHAIGRIGTTENGGGAFEGYTDRAETDKKILRDVFVEGDAWFATGDLMRRDDQGYFHFVDRVGDTFRWKGENVATGEVSEAIRDCPGIVDAATYGVAVPGCDGRAGMVALVTEEGFDPAVLAKHLGRRLPPYAIPVFLRLCRTLDTTETFKQQKQRLVREGFDPSAADDQVFLRHPADGLYRPLDADVRARIADRGIKF